MAADLIHIWLEKLHKSEWRTLSTEGLTSMYGGRPTVALCRSRSPAGSRAVRGVSVKQVARKERYRQK